LDSGFFFGVVAALTLVPAALALVDAGIRRNLARTARWTLLTALGAAAIVDAVYAAVVHGLASDELWFSVLRTLILCPAVTLAWGLTGVLAWAMRPKALIA
jgi:hypothetical protein